MIASLRSLGQRRGARQIAAEGVDRHRIGAIQAAHEIGDGVLGVHEAAIHEVAGIEQHEHVGADERVGARIETRLAGRPALASSDQRPGRAVFVTCMRGRLPSAKVAIFCRMPSSRSGNRWASGR